MRLGFIAFICLFGSIQSCTFYKRDILFKAPKEKEKEFAKKSTTEVVAKNYLTNKNDYIEFQIFTNKGEVLIDPTSEFSKQVSGGGNGGNVFKIRYLIQGDGYADLPIIGKTKLDSLTLHQCDSLLSKLYSKFYLEAFVISKISSRRVFVLGKGAGTAAGGGGGQSAGASVLELENENMTLIEVLAKIGGAGLYSHTDRIKIIRGDLRNPKIMTVDLTRWDSFQKSELIILPNDIIYITPGRRRAFDFLRDVTTLTGIVSAALTFYLFILLK